MAAKPPLSSTMRTELWPQRNAPCFDAVQWTGYRAAVSSSAAECGVSGWSVLRLPPSSLVGALPRVKPGGSWSSRVCMPHCPSLRCPW